MVPEAMHREEHEDGGGPVEPVIGIEGEEVEDLVEHS